MSVDRRHIKRLAIQVEATDGSTMLIYSESPGMRLVMSQTIEEIPSLFGPPAYQPEFHVEIEGMNQRRIIWGGPMRPPPPAEIETGDVLDEPRDV